MAASRTARSRDKLQERSRQRKSIRPQDLKDLARFLWEKGLTLTHAMEKDAADWIRTLRRRSASGKTRIASWAIFRKIAKARSFFDGLQGSRPENPFRRYRTRRSDRPVSTALPLGPEQLKCLVETMNPESPWGLRNRAIALLRFQAHLSVAEICRLRRDQLVLGKKMLALRLLRNGRTLERIPLPRPVQTALRNYLNLHLSKGPLLFQAMPESFSTSEARLRRRPGQPLSAPWVRSMLRKAGQAAGFLFRRA